MLRRTLLLALLLALGATGIARANVILTDLAGSWQGNRIVITWRTASENDVSGFDVYRSTEPLSPRQVLDQATKLTTALITNPAGPCQTTGASYQFADTTADPATERYYYWVVAHSCNGSIVWPANDPGLEVARQYRLFLPIILRAAAP